MFVANKLCLNLRSISCAIVYKTRCVRVNPHTRISKMQRVAGAMFAKLRNVKTTQNNLTNQLMIDHVKVTQQLDTVTWQLGRVTEKLDKQMLYMHLWFTVLLGINFRMYLCMMFMVKHGHYSACYVPKQNVTDDVHRETVQGYHVTNDVQVLVDGLQYLFGFFVVSPSRE